MTARWRKVFRDLWQECTRALLAVLAIAAGIACFAAILASYAILTRELNNGYLATNPASATLRVDRVDDDLVRTVLANRAVSDAEPRRTIFARIKGGTTGWRPLTLFVVKDYADIRLNKLSRELGAWPPGTGEILIERDAFQVAHTRIGESVTVKTIDGKEQHLRVTGSVHDVGQAQARMENIVYGYITAATLARLGQEPYLNQLNILVAVNRLDEPHIRTVVEQVRETIEHAGHRVLRIDIPTPGKHPHAAIMGLLLLSMSSFGLFVMLLSGIIVVNLLAAIMASQTRQIGMMKAIGATRGQIAGIYFAQALMLGVAAGVIALPLGVWGSRVLCRYQAIFLNFDITSFAIPLWVYLLVAIIGLLVPLLAAAYPVWKGSGISVREALADYGVGRNAFGTTRFDRALAGMGGLARPVLLAIRNNFRRRGRLVLTLLTLTLGGLFFMAALNLRASMIGTLDRLFAARKFDLAISLTAMQPFDDVQRILRNTPGVVSAEGWIATEAGLPGAKETPMSPGHAGGGLHGGGGVASDRFTMLAVPAQTPMLSPDITEGRGLLKGDVDTVVINTALAAKGPQLRVGSIAAFVMGPGRVPLRIVGIAREPFSPPLAYMPRAFFDRLEEHRGTTNAIRVVLAGNTSMDKVKADIERNLNAAGIQAANISSKSDSRFGFDQHMVMIYVFLIVTACLLAAVGGLGLMTTMSLNVLERRREMGVMRALGASPATVWLMLVTEGAVIGVLSWAFASAAAWPLGKAIGSLLVKTLFQTAFDFTFDMRGPLIWLAVSLFLGAIASSLPAWHASRQPIREALGYE